MARHTSPSEKDQEFKAPDLTGPMYVFGVVVLTLYLALTSQTYVFRPMLYTMPVLRLWFLPAFNVLIVYVLIVFYLACSVEPGRVPVH